MNPSTETLISIAEAAKLRFRQRAEELRHNGSALIQVVEFNDGEAERIERAIAQAGLKCEWKFIWHHETSCGNKHFFNSGGPVKNNFKFCPFCGREIE